jgi:hypothetical protein
MGCHFLSYGRRTDGSLFPDRMAPRGARALSTWYFISRSGFHFKRAGFPFSTSATQKDKKLLLLSAFGVRAFRHKTLSTISNFLVSKQIILLPHKTSMTPQAASPRWLVALLLHLTLLLSTCHHFAVVAKEIEVTKEWTKVGENDTVPAGMHIRMDMTTGGKWVKLPDDEDDETKGDDDGGADSTRAVAVVIQSDGSVELSDINTEEKPKGDDKKGSVQYDFEMMHRTLSKLPEEEMERFGGLPELPQAAESKTKVLTPKERQFFEKRMAEIWEQRQAELKEAQTHLVDVPAVLKERMKGIRDYLREPLEQLKKVDLEKDDDGTVVRDIVGLLKDLEFQLIDVDNARDFHTVGGWEMLVSLLSENMHLQNKTITKLSRATEEKIRAVQAYAAWTIGTAVKNTGEFFPYAIEMVKVGPKTTNALDLLLDVFCQEYKDENAWPIRTLLAKTIYGIGALLRGNRLSQAHLIESNGAARLSDKLHHMVMGNFSKDIKVIQRLLSLAGDMITDVQLDGDASTAALDDAIIQAFTSTEWCDILSTLLITDTFLPVRVQETLMETVHSLAPYCSSNETTGNGWKGKSTEHKAAIERFQKEWQQNKDDFDSDHWKELNERAATVSKIL